MWSFSASRRCEGSLMPPGRPLMVITDLYMHARQLTGSAKALTGPRESKLQEQGGHRRPPSLCGGELNPGFPCIECRGRHSDPPILIL